MTKAAIALKRYEKDQGYKAKSMEDLVPNYLKEWPTDEFNGSKLKIINSPSAYGVYYHGKENADHGGSNEEYSLLINHKKIKE